jgi:hypothetical protein
LSWINPQQRNHNQKNEFFEAWAIYRPVRSPRRHWRNGDKAKSGLIPACSPSR